MRLIELLGIPGSGKSTMLGLIEADAAASGRTLLRIGPAAQRAVAHHGGDPVVRLVARTAGRWSSSLWKQASSRSSDRIAVLSRAVARRPELVAAIIEANRSNNSEDGQDVVMGMMLNHLISLQLAEEVLGEEEWLILSEGLCQRVVSLFAAGPDAGYDRSEVERYLSLVPVPDIVVALSVPVDVSFERLERAGWSRRISRRTPAERRGFLERSAELVAITAEQMGKAGATVVHVDSSGQLDAGVAAVTSAVLGT